MILIEVDDDASTATATATTANKNSKNENNIKKNKLEFVHITKTGGSAIEREASMKNITWGACHYIILEYNGIGCQNPDLYDKLNGFNASNVPFEFEKSFGEPWHTPSHWMNHRPYIADDIDTFTVVREPYSRAVSQFYCKYKGFKGPVEQRNNATVMNVWLRDLFNNSVKVKKAHFLPQHYYVYDRNGRKLIDHILKYEEDLSYEFSKLMKKYDLNVSLPDPSLDDKKFNARNASSSLTIEDLDSKTIQLINNVYGEDFLRFNYTMIKI